jgi:hypothetical protein
MEVGRTSAKLRSDRATFTEDFQKQNVERQKVGLQPLDWYAWDGSCANGPEATKLRKIMLSTNPNPPNQEKGPVVTPSPFQSPSAL